MKRLKSFSGSTSTRLIWRKPQSGTADIEAKPSNTKEMAEIMDSVKIELTPETQAKLATGFDRLITKVDSKVDTAELKHKVEIARKERNMEKARTQFVSVGVDLQLMLKDQEIEGIQRELDGLMMQIDPKYKMLGELKGLRKLFDKIPKWAMPEGTGKVSASAADMRAAIERFYVLDDKTGKYRARTQLELIKNETDKAEGFFGKIGGFFKGLFMGLLGRGKLKSAESAVNLGFEKQEQFTAMEAEYKGAVRTIGEKAEATAAGAATMHKAWMENPELVMARREADRALRQFGGKHGDNINGFMRSAVNGKNTDKAIGALTEDSGKFMRRVGENPALQEELIKRHKNGQDIGRKFGVELKRAGGIMVFSLSVQAMRDAIKARDPEVFVDNMTNSNMLTESLPPMGSIRSVGRLDEKNGDPIWAKGLDVGMNVVGDGVMLVGMVGGAIAGFTGGGIAGFFGGFGIGAVPGAAAGGAAGAAGGASVGLAIKTALVTAGRWTVKTAANMGSKEAIKGGGKAALKSVTKQVAKRQRVVNEFGEKVYQVTFKAANGSDVIVEATTKKALKRQMAGYGYRKSGKKFVRKGFVRETLSNGVKFEAITAGFSTSMDKVVEKMDLKDKLVEVGTSQFKKRVSPVDLEIYKTFTGRSLSFMG